MIADWLHKDETLAETRVVELPKWKELHLTRWHVIILPVALVRGNKQF